MTDQRKELLEATAAPLHACGYTIRPLRMYDWAEFTELCGSVEAKLNPDGSEGEPVPIPTRDVSVFLTWLSLRRDHPEFKTLEDLKAAEWSMETFKRVSEAVQRVNQLDEGDPGNA